MKKMFLVGACVALCFQFIYAQNPVQEKRRSDRKIIELKKIITISPTQEDILRIAYELNQKQSDSILFKVQDPALAATLKYEADKKLKQTLMNTLTESQRNKYIRITSTPEVMEKATAKVALLRETSSYTEAQLDSAQIDIFNYLMLEKVVYARDKYDYRKQKENIAQLKKLQPDKLKKANAQEKLKHQGNAKTGRYQW